MLKRTINSKIQQIIRLFRLNKIYYQIYLQSYDQSVYGETRYEYLHDARWHHYLTFLQYFWSFYCSQEQSELGYHVEDDRFFEKYFVPNNNRKTMKELTPLCLVHKYPSRPVVYKLLQVLQASALKSFFH